MALIDISYFKNELYIDLSNEDVKTNLENIFDWVEKKYLELLLGKELYKLFVASKTVEPYLTLINGGSFIWVNSERTYYGLKRMLACFTYFEYKKKNQTYNTDLGDVKVTNNAGQSIGLDLVNMDDAYNEAVELYWEAYKYMTVTTGFELQNTSRAINYINSLGRKL